MRKGAERVPGFQEDIHPGVWQRHTVLGCPQKWAMAWMAICGYGVAYILYALPIRLLIPLGVVWALGQGVLALLTTWDPQWDDVLLASLKYRRYKKRYEAG
jgi:type IV secretory pathway TrbD component